MATSASCDSTFFDRRHFACAVDNRIKVSRVRAVIGIVFAEPSETSATDRSRAYSSEIASAASYKNVSEKMRARFVVCTFVKIGFCILAT